MPLAFGRADHLEKSSIHIRPGRRRKRTRTIGGHDPATGDRLIHFAGQKRSIYRKIAVTREALGMGMGAQFFRHGRSRGGDITFHGPGSILLSGSSIWSDTASG